MRSPLTAGSIARVQLVFHAHMTVSVHLTRLAHAGNADLGPEDRLALPTWAAPHGRTQIIQFGTQLMQASRR